MKASTETLTGQSGQLPTENDIFLNANPRGASQQILPREIQSLYGFAEFSFRDYLYLTATARNDWSSTLNPNDNSFFYPSVGISALISEMVDIPKVSLLKVRASIADVGKDTRIGDTSPVIQFETNPTNFGNTETRGLPDRIVNPNLKPEITTTKELGLQAQFFDKRFGFDLTYYKEETRNQIVRTLPTLNQSGFASGRYLWFCL